MNKNSELARRIYNQKMVEKIDTKMNLLGIYNKLETMRFLNMRLFTCFVIFFLCLYFFNFGYIIAPCLPNIKKKCAAALHFALTNFARRHGKSATVAQTPKNLLTKHLPARSRRPAGPFF